MSIKTLQNQSQFLGRAFPTLLKLSKGEMQGNRPVDLDYFKPREFLNEIVREYFYNIYGEKPTKFANVGLLGNSLETIAPHWMEEWGKSAGLIKRCDGETLQVWRDSEGKMQSEPMQCACVALSGEQTCKPTMYLSLILPELIQASGYLGVVRLTLHSPRELSHVLTVLQAQPSVVGLPVERCRWFIGRHAEDVTVTINDKPAKTKKYFVKLSIDMENTLAGNPLLEAGEIRQITAKTDVDAETGEVIGESVDYVPNVAIEKMLFHFEENVPNVGAYDILGGKEPSEVNLLDGLVETGEGVIIMQAEVIEQVFKGRKTRYYNLETGFNPTKRVILMSEIEPIESTGSKVKFESQGLVRLEKTKGGNYAAFPIS